MIVRRERPSDEAVVRSIHAAAFRRDAAEPAEAALLDALRGCDGWLDRFSLVAELDGVVVGHNVCTRGYVDAAPVLGLGPIGVRPDGQHAGVGLALMQAMIGAADASDEPLIALLGSPDYYRRFGFVTSTDVAIEPPDSAWGVHFQVRTLSGYDPAIRGRFAYPAPFDLVS